MKVKLTHPQLKQLLLLEASAQHSYDRSRARVQNNLSRALLAYYPYPSRCEITAKGRLWLANWRKQGGTES